MNASSRPSKIHILFALTAIILLAASLAQRYLGHTLANPDLDFHDYYFAAQLVADNPQASLYEGALKGNPQLRSAPPETPLAERAKAAGIDDIELYLYPPLLADLLVPAAHLPLRLAAMLWRTLNLALVVLCVLLLARTLRLRILSFEVATFLALAYAFWPIHEAISLGQVAILMLALWTVGVCAYFQGRPTLSALAFALATALKVTPILLLPLFFIWKDKRWIAWYLSSLAALFAIMAIVNGTHNLADFAHIMQSMSSTVPALQNKCVASLVAWLYYGRLFTTATVHEVLNAPAPLLALIGKAIGIFFYAACLFLVWRRRTLAARPTLLAVFALVTAAISPISWRHGYTVALIPLAILWVRTLREAVPPLNPTLLAFTTITFGSLAFDLAAQLPLPMLGKIVLAATWVVSSVLLCLDVLRRDPPLTPAAG